jgi:hypothetical protein
VGGEIVHHDADFLGLGEVNIADLTHALGEVLGSASIGDFHFAPWLEKWRAGHFFSNREVGIM